MLNCQHNRKVSTTASVLIQLGFSLQQPLEKHKALGLRAVVTEGPKPLTGSLTGILSSNRNASRTAQSPDSDVGADPHLRFSLPNRRCTGAGGVSPHLPPPEPRRVVTGSPEAPAGSLTRGFWAPRPVRSAHRAHEWSEPLAATAPPVDVVVDFAVGGLGVATTALHPSTRSTHIVLQGGRCGGGHSSRGTGVMVKPIVRPASVTSSHLDRDVRITFCKSQGGRRYMEDSLQVHCKRSDVTGKVDWLFLGVYDGHGGADAARFTRTHLMPNITNSKAFESHDDQEILRAIKEGFLHTHLAMWKEVFKWPKTSSGYTSTAGTTASVAIIKNGKIYTGHVGDSGIVLAKKEHGDAPSSSPTPTPKVTAQSSFSAVPLTVDHKPNSPEELSRIRDAGGEVAIKAGVHRVVWSRPRMCDHVGPIRRSTKIDKIPFLAVARSLGDLWSYNSAMQSFIVSPEPDLSVLPLAANHVALILGSDGLWNVMRPSLAVNELWHDIRNPIDLQKYNSETLKKRAKLERRRSHDESTTTDSEDEWNDHADSIANHARFLVKRALVRWSYLRADNTSVIVAVLDPPPTPPNHAVSAENGAVSTFENGNPETPAKTAETEARLMSKLECFLENFGALPDLDGETLPRLFGHENVMLYIREFGSYALRTRPEVLTYYGRVDEKISPVPQQEITGGLSQQNRLNLENEDYSTTVWEEFGFEVPTMEIFEKGNREKKCPENPEDKDDDENPLEQDEEREDFPEDLGVVETGSFSMTSSSLSIANNSGLSTPSCLPSPSSDSPRKTDVPEHSHCSPSKNSHVHEPSAKNSHAQKPPQESSVKKFHASEGSSHALFKAGLTPTLVPAAASKKSSDTPKARRSNDHVEGRPPIKLTSEVAAKSNLRKPSTTNIAIELHSAATQGKTTGSSTKNSHGPEIPHGLHKLPAKPSHGPNPASKNAHDSATSHAFTTTSSGMHLRPSSVSAAGVLQLPEVQNGHSNSSKGPKTPSHVVKSGGSCGKTPAAIVKQTNFSYDTRLADRVTRSGTKLSPSKQYMNNYRLAKSSFSRPNSGTFSPLSVSRTMKKRRIAFARKTPSATALQKQRKLRSTLSPATLASARFGGKSSHHVLHRRGKKSTLPTASSSSLGQNVRKTTTQNPTTNTANFRKFPANSATKSRRSLSAEPGQILARKITSGQVQVTSNQVQVTCGQMKLTSGQGQLTYDDLDQSSRRIELNKSIKRLSFSQPSTSAKTASTLVSKRMKFGLTDVELLESSTLKTLTRPPITTMQKLPIIQRTTLLTSVVPSSSVGGAQQKPTDTQPHVRHLAAAEKYCQGPKSYDGPRNSGDGPQKYLGGPSHAADAADEPAGSRLRLSGPARRLASSEEYFTGLGQRSTFRTGQDSFGPGQRSIESLNLEVQRREPQREQQGIWQRMLDLADSTMGVKFRG